ncbi:hypothetical protein GCM10011349_05400 [Novosphingobium indicum]|uniref:Uncharacterized protein n=1 Tax=Novosphingobium indicum TaxID=462949 RepID=A0ABQ2JBF1_9SPHN|nr:hypothetical protein GCM10011349_05400 [Novosphingobium indicum]
MLALEDHDVMAIEREGPGHRQAHDTGPHYNRANLFHVLPLVHGGRDETHFADSRLVKPTLSAFKRPPREAFHLRYVCVSRSGTEVCWRGR